MHSHACWQVAAEYELVHRAMAQPPVQDYLPASWTNLAHVKAEHFCALAHYHAAMALCESSRECIAHTPVCTHRGSLLTLIGLSDPSQQPRGNCQGRSTSSSPQLPVSPKVPHCRSTRKSSGNLVRHHRQGPGPNVAGCPPSHSATGIPAESSSWKYGAGGDRAGDSPSLALLFSMTGLS